ncbi:MAG: diguanylate cyclase domain-containing protein [Alphaproteobacteria bacterium]
MPLYYDLNEQIAALTHISKDALAWGASIHEAYAQGKNSAMVPPLDQDMERWCESIIEHDAICPYALEDLKALYRQAKAAIHTPEKFSSAFNAFINAMIKIEQDVLLTAAGIDVQTGLKHRSIMRQDIEKEMERLSREGKAFSIALVQISGFDVLKEKCADGEEKQYEKSVANVMKTILRPFDDAYFIGDGAFILTLKQSESGGGVKAMERLKVILDTKDIQIDTSGGASGHISLTCRIAEPVADDDAEDIIQNLILDAEKTADEESTVFEYQEMSPLQRFAQDISQE